MKRRRRATAIKPFNGFHRASTPKVFRQMSASVSWHQRVRPGGCGRRGRRGAPLHSDRGCRRIWTDWEEAGEFPRSLYQRAADLGWLGLGYPERFGGTPAPWALRNALTIALGPQRGQRRPDGQPVQPQHRFAAGAAPWLCGLAAAGGARRAGRRKIAALAITEPGGGTDVSALKTTARAARATSTWWMAKRPSSPPACAPTGSRWRCALT